MNSLEFYREKFTESSFLILEQAIDDCRRREQNYLSFAHLLKALKSQLPEVFDQALASLQTEPPVTVKLLESMIAASPLF